MTQASETAVARSYEIAGQIVTMPVEVRDSSAGTAMFLVPAEEAQELLPGDAFQVIEAAPGLTQLALVVVDYRDNDLGDYHEVGIVFFVTPKGGGPETAGTYIWKLPVDQEFTREAGERIWGFPKTVERIDFEYTDDRVRCRLEMDGRHVFTLTVPRRHTDEPAEPLPQLGYTLIGGRPHVTRSTMTSRGTAISPGGEGVELELGDHPVAGALRRLGLPKAAILSTWSEHQGGVFEAPEPL